jgi:hypothetical protein
MDIDATVLEYAEYVGWQDKSIGGNDHRVGAEAGEPVDHIGVAQRRRL